MTLILVRTQGPVNLGMVARLCGNFAITDLRLVAPRCEIDCEDARKFSVHAKPLLLSAPVFPDLRSATADCGLVIGTTARLRDDTAGEPMLPEEIAPLLARRPTGRWALVFGNEADGLNDEELRACQAYVRLRHFGEVYSFNLSHAVGILLYTLAGQDAPQPAREVPPGATREEIGRLYTYWMHTLTRFGYFRRTTAERFAPLLERFLGRQHLSIYDVQMLWSMLAQFHYKAFGDRAEQGHDPTGKGRRLEELAQDQENG